MVIYIYVCGKCRTHWHNLCC